MKSAKNQANAKQQPEAESFAIWKLSTFLIHIIIQKW